MTPEPIALFAGVVAALFCGLYFVFRVLPIRAGRWRWYYIGFSLASGLQCGHVAFVLLVEGRDFTVGHMLALLIAASHLVMARMQFGSLKPDISYCTDYSPLDDVGTHLVRKK